MKTITLDSYAKINLALDILYKREDNYHEIRTVMQSISLKDQLTFREIEENKLIIESNSKEMPLDSRNLVYKAWEEMKKFTGVEKGLYIYIDKNIPIGAGLAGGSSNAATTLKAINQLWATKLNIEDLIKIGTGIGADVPFCLIGGTALAEGIGEKLVRLKSLKNKKLLLCNPGIEISSAYAYSILKLNGHRLHIDEMVDCIEKEDMDCIYRNMANKMEEAIIRENPVIDEIKDLMDKNGAKKSLMSGSGSTVFGIFESEEERGKAEVELLKRFKKVYKCETI